MITTIGMLSMYASQSGVTMFVAAGPARDHGDARTAGRVRVALGHVAGALLVAHEDVADRRVDQRVVDREDGAARKAEHDLGALHLEALDEGLGSGQLHRGLRWSVVRIVGIGLFEGTKNPSPGRGAGAHGRESAPCAR